MYSGLGRFSVLQAMKGRASGPSKGCAFRLAQRAVWT